VAALRWYEIVSEGRKHPLPCRATFVAALLLLATIAPRAGTVAVFGPQTLTRTTGAPNTFDFTFDVQNPSLPYTLRIDNDGIASAVVTINGTEIAGPSSFNPGIKVIERAVSVRASNALHVELRSKPGSQITIRILGTDNDPPAIAPIATPAPNAAGWNRTDVGVTFVCSDADSGIASCSPPVTVTTEGQRQIVTGTAVDNAGNSATASVTLNIDKTAPAIRPLVQPAPNGSGWVNQAATVTFSCIDDLSGITSCQAPVTVPSDGSQVVRGTATDRAANTATVTFGVNVDRTPPTVTATTLPQPNAAGWNNTDVTVTFECSDPTSGVGFCPPPTTVSTDGANQRVDGTARDRADNSATASSTVSLDKTPPTITPTALPAPNAAGWNNTDVKVSFTCDDSASGVVSCPDAVTMATEGANQVVSRTVLDKADNSATASVALNIDKSKPTITAKADPPADAQGRNDTDVIVSFSCDDAGSGIAVCPAPITVSTEGPGQRIEGTTEDKAGNTERASVTLDIDKSPMTVTIVSPVAGDLRRDTNAIVAGTIGGRRLPAVNVNGVPASVAGTGPFQFSALLPLVEGVNSLVVTATNAAGRLVQASTVVTRDTEPPTIDLVTPDRISSSRSGPVTANVSDSNGVAEVIFRVNGAEASRLTASPYAFNLSVPSGARNGDVVEIVVEARDRAGNAATANRAVRVLADGVIVGHVMSDETGLPIPDAAVRMGSAYSTTTDATGRYLLPAPDSSEVLIVEKDGMTSVQRPVATAAGVGTVPVDARLTPLVNPVTVGAGGGQVTIAAGETRSWTATFPVAAGVFPQGAEARLTPLTPQGLPMLLPLGWSPVAAFEFRAGSEPSTPLSAAITSVGEARAVVRLDPATHAWRVVRNDLTPLDGRATVDVDQLGTYALIAPDASDPPLVAPPPGEILTGVGMVALPPAASGTAHGVPSSLPATGGLVRGSLVVQCPSPVPSGTVIQAAVTETFTLTSGDVASGEKRYQDLILYRLPTSATDTPPEPGTTTLGSAFPIMPSRTFAAVDLSQGNIHLDILAGRESARGSVGGTDALDLETGSARLSVSAGSLARNTAIDLQTVAPSSSYPSTPGLTPVGELIVDFAGAGLSRSATISISATGLTATDSFVVARVDRQDGVMALVVVSLARIVSGRLVSSPYPGLAGITQGAHYVLYRSSLPLGFVGGVTSASTGAVTAFVSTASLPFVAFSGSDGAYVVPAVAGAASVSARVRGTGLAGSGAAQVTRGATTPLNLLLSGAITTAVVTPADGSMAVLTTTQIQIDASVALNAATATSSTIKLVRADSVSVPLRFITSLNGRSLTAIPQTKLDAATQYTLVVSGLADAFGGLVAIPATTFTTKSEVIPAFDARRLTFSFPDVNGIVQVIAPADSLAPGSYILVTNTSNGVIVSMTALNDGSVRGELPASINDTLLVAVTDPLGNVTTFSRSQYVAQDGTTAVGPGGGVVQGAGGVEVRIPDGAIAASVTIKVEPFDASAFAERPDFPQAQFGSGLRMISPELPTFSKPVTLAFSIPANLPSGAPKEDAFYYVYRRLSGPDGRVAFEAVDHAFVQGTGADARVVTASFPFATAWHSFNTWLPEGVIATQEAQFYLMWTYDAQLPGKPLIGVVSGRVLRPRFEKGNPTPVIDGVAGAIVSGVDAQGNPLLDSNSTSGSPTVAISQADGTFAFWDDWPTAGTVTVNAQSGAEHASATGVQANVATTTTPPALQYYSNRVTVNVTFPPANAPTATTAMRLVLLRASDLTPIVDSLVLAKTEVFVGFKTDCGGVPCAIRSAQLNGSTMALRAASVPGLDGWLAGPVNLDTIGVNRFTATAQDPATQDDINATLLLRVVAAGVADPSDPRGTLAAAIPPSVLPGQTSPSDGATNIDLNPTLRIVFSEAVTRIPHNVTLAESVSGVPVPIDILGTGPGGEIAELNTDADITTSAVALTIQPLASLKYGTRYRLAVLGGIRDLDVPVARSLDPAPYQAEFETEKIGTPGTVGGSAEHLSSSGIAIVGSRAYLAENEFTFGHIRAFDFTDPMNPTPVGLLPESPQFYGKPMSIAAQNGPAGYHRVAVVTGPANKSIPSNLRVYDVADDPAAANIKWVGAATLSATAQEGIGRRVALLGSFAYVLTMNKGIQVVDVGAAVAGFAGDISDVRIPLNTDGRGWGQQFVVSTIPILKRSGRPAFMSDLKAANFVLNGALQPIVAAVGEEVGLTIVNPFTNQVLYTGPPQLVVDASTVPPSVATITWGYAVALARLTITDDNGDASDHDVAIVSGTGSEPGGATSLLMLIDLADLSNPQVLGYLPMARATDIVVQGSQAIVGDTDRIRLVDLSHPANMQVLGEIAGLGGWLAVTPGGVVLSTGKGLDPGANDPLGGVRSANITPAKTTCGDLLTLLTPRVVLTSEFNPSTNTTCPAVGVKIQISLCRAATVDVQIPTGGWLQGFVAADGCASAGQPYLLMARPLPSGTHTLQIPVQPNAQTSDVLSFPKTFLISARDQENPNLFQQESVESLFVTKTDINDFFRVGHTRVKGVDLADGHLTRQAVDLRIPGRNLDLHVTRSYSSNATDPSSSFGTGWTWNYAAGLVERRGCNCVYVTTPDGTSVRFLTLDWHTFTAEKGYHSRLVPTNTLSTGYIREYDFIDKSGTRYHFKDVSNNPDTTDPAKCPPKFRLEYLEEPHGDHIRIDYESAYVDTVREVSEWKSDGTKVRSLAVRSSSQSDGFLHITHIEARDGSGNPLGLSVDYEYSRSTLTRVTRTGTVGELSPAAVEQYEYGLDRRLTRSVIPNGRATEPKTDVVEFTYGGGITIGLTHPAVTEICEFVTAGAALTTKFAYDHGATQLAAGQLKTTVTDARHNDSVYTLNLDGNQIKVEAPFGKTTVMTWAANDVLKTSETDALGRKTLFGYDQNGNLTSQRIDTNEFGAVEATYEYELHFNKLVLKTDALGRQTRYEIDQANGDVLGVTDPVGNKTAYRYANGLLTTQTNPRMKVTTYSGFDPFGNAQIIDSDPSIGVRTTRSFDTLGRLIHSSDTQGHETTISYDTLGRVIEERKVAGGSPQSDALTLTDYDAAGQVRAQTSADGAKTTLERDGLDRIIRTTTVGTGVSVTTETGYDQNGNKTREKDRRGVEKVSTYDALNRLTQVDITAGLPGEAPMGTIAKYEYDLVGNKTAETDLAGLTTRFEYDELNRLRTKILPENGANGAYVERYTYDKVGNRTSVTDANGHTTSFEYDALNRVIRKTDPLGHVTTTAYDDSPSGHVNKTEEHDLTRGLRTTFEYDALNRETRRSVFLEGTGSAGEVYVTATEYDDTTHTRTTTDSRGAKATETFDGLDRTVQHVVHSGALGLATDLTTETTYDGLGNPTSVKDPNGNVTAFERDGLGRLVRTTDAKNNQSTITYDGEGLKISETNRRNVTTTSTYDNLGRPRKTTIAPTLSSVGWSHEVRYDDPGRTRTEVDARLAETVSHLDGLNRVVRTTDAQGHDVVTVYDGVNKRAETDRRGNTTRFEYDALNRLTKTTDPAPFDAQTVETSYDDAANRRVDKDRRGTTTVTQLDPLGRTRSVTRAGVVLETNTYDGNSNKESATDGEGKVTQFVYDAANRLTSQTAAFGSADAATTSFRYDNNGNRIEERDARATSLGAPYSVKNAYDELNRLTSVTDGEGGVKVYDYDLEGNRASVQDALGHVTSFDYDELDKLVAVTQPGGVTTRYTYDANRNRLTQTDGNGHTVAMEYDSLNRLTKTTQEGGLVTRQSYDANGHLAEVTDPKGQTASSSYDELNRLKATTYAALPGEVPAMWRHTTSVAKTFDANGNIVQVDESVASGTDPPVLLGTTRTYDAFDRLISDTSPLPDGGLATITYTYFANGSRKSITDPGGVTTSYTYDGQNRLAAATTDAGTTHYTYYPDGLGRETIYPNGVRATRHYDRADRLTSLVNANGSTLISSYNYTYDAEGNRLSQVETNGGAPETTGYTYDTFNRLLSVSYPIDTTFPTGRVVTYEYDSVGNRVRETERDGTGVVIADKKGTFDGINRLTQLDDVLDASRSTAFGYDSNGNQTAKTVGGVTTKYLYDSRDKMIETQFATGGTRFQYDFDGRRSKKIGEDGIRQYVYDGTSILLEYDSAARQVAKYDYGSTHLISLTRKNEPRKFYSFDALGTVVGLTDATGGPAATYHLDAWGNYRFQTELDASRNRIGFTGHLWDRETDLFYAKARFYDPQSARFITQDGHTEEIDTPPSLHRYVYAINRPTTWTDPTGTTAENWDEFDGDRDLLINEQTRLAAPDYSRREALFPRGVFVPAANVEVTKQLLISEARFKYLPGTDAKARLVIETKRQLELNPGSTAGLVDEDAKRKYGGRRLRLDTKGDHDPTNDVLAISATADSPIEFIPAAGITREQLETQGGRQTYCNVFVSACSRAFGGPALNGKMNVLVDQLESRSLEGYRKVTWQEALLYARYGGLALVVQRRDAERRDAHGHGGMLTGGFDGPAPSLEGLRVMQAGRDVDVKPVSRAFQGKPIVTSPVRSPGEPEDMKDEGLQFFIYERPQGRSGGK
jgi:RHS repeat-associated protein